MDLARIASCALRSFCRSRTSFGKCLPLARGTAGGAREALDRLTVGAFARASLIVGEGAAVGGGRRCGLGRRPKRKEREQKDRTSR
jgi:hypothetical protein